MSADGRCPMRSVYAKILLWALVTLLVSLTFFAVISHRIAIQMGSGALYRDVQLLELDEAREAYEAGGQAREAAIVRRFDHVMKWRHYVLDSHGKELGT